jgi:hypothetical protein
MSSYVITGASRGLGVSHVPWQSKYTFDSKNNIDCRFEQLEFVRQLSSDSNNIVIGLVRDKSTTERTIAEEVAGRSNFHILQADMADYEAIRVRRITKSGLKESLLTPFE